MQARDYYVRICPLPITVHLYEVSSRRPIGPRAWNLFVLMATSAPRPSSPPSLKRVGAVDEHGAGVHLVQKPHRRRVVLCHYRVGMTGAVLLDVLQRLVERIDHSDASDQGQELGAPVLIGCDCRLETADPVGRADETQRAAVAGASRRPLRRNGLLSPAEIRARPTNGRSWCPSRCIPSTAAPWH